jgi:hypothetical protein
MIIFDEERKQMVDTDNGDHMELTLRDREDAEYSCSIEDQNGRAYVCASLNCVGATGFKKWIMTSAWEPKRNTPYKSPTDFEVDPIFIDRMTLFLRRLLETRWSFGELTPNFEFVDARKDVELAK